MRWMLIMAVLLAGTAEADVRLYVFDCGTLDLADVSPFGLDGSETPVRRLFVPCYLIEHRGDGDAVQRLLFDAGLPADVAGQGPVTPEPGMTLRYERALTGQLEDLGVTPADVDYVAFSHLHFDHVGSANDFSGSKLLIQRPEYQAGFVERNSQIYQLELFSGLADAPRMLLDGDHDVFGDGRVRLISTPGHTPGHQALLVHLASTGPVVLSGDLYHFRASRRLRRVPVFNTDPDATLDSMDRLEALLETEGATLWIEHDQALADTLRLAPGYYE